MKDYDKQERTYEEKLREEAQEEPAYKLLKEAFDSGLIRIGLDTPMTRVRLFHRIRVYLQTGFVRV